MSVELPTDLLFYVRDDEGETWAYQLVTNPLAALYWKPSSYPKPIASAARISISKR